MSISNVILPVVTDRPAEAVAFYRDVLGLPVKRTFRHAGFELTWLGDVVVLHSPSEEALRVPRQVAAIFVVDDLDAYWKLLHDAKAEVLQAPWKVPTGRAFVVRHPDGRAVEYLELDAS